MATTSGNEWKREHGPNRPFWEPVRLVDFDGERLKALEKLRQELIVEAESSDMPDERLALHCILELLFTQATVTGSAGVAETTRRATARLPQPTGRGKRRLTQQRREHLIGVVGQMWEIFTAYNFPLPSHKPTEN